MKRRGESRPIALSDPPGDGTLSVGAAHVLVVAAIGFFLVNIVPCFTVDFYQDDFRHFWILSGWGWDLGAALRQEGIEQGFRPLLYAFRLVRWNLFGESVVVQRSIQVGVYLLIAMALARIAWRLGGSRFHGAVALLFFLSAVLTRPTIYSFVAINLADLFILATYLLLLEGAARGWATWRLVTWTVLVAALALFVKENGVAAPTGAALLALWSRNRLGSGTSVRLIGAHAALLAVYGAVYWVVASARYMGLEGAEPTMSVVVGASKGFAFSLAGPIAAVYLSLRDYGWSVVATVIVALAVSLALGWIWWKAHRGREGIVEKVRRRASLLAVLVILIGANLAPYLVGGWFENRMLVPAFGLGVVLWSIILGDALEAWDQLVARERKAAWIPVSIIVLAGALSAGSPLPTRSQERMAQEMRAVVLSARERGIESFCLVGFPSRGSDMRIANARGLVGYVAGSEVRVSSADAVEELGPNVGECLLLSYAEERRAPVPLRVTWPSSPR